MSDPKDVSTPSPETAPQPAPETPEIVAEATAAPVEQPVPASPAAEEPNFAQLLEQYESESETAGPKVGEHRSGTVVNVKEDVVLVDIGAKAEGTIAIDQVRTPEGTVELKAGDPLEVVIEGRDDEGNFKLSKFSPERPRSVEDARAAFEEKIVVRGRVTGVVKGGLTVDIGMRAFLPQSRSGVRDASEMHKLVGQEIRCRVARAPEKSNVVLDRRSLLEEEQKAAEDAALSRLHEGEVVEGRVKSLATYGAFVDLGGVDALLHVSDMSWTRLADPAKVLSIGDTAQVKILKLDTEKRRISVGIKQLQADPWQGIEERYPVGDRVKGTVQRLTDFGAFVELETGVEGLIHISEMSWSRRVHKPSDAVKVGEVVEAVVLAVNAHDRRISLGLKQALGDPWEDAVIRFKPGTVVEGRVRNVQPFGAFVELAEGIDGMIHIGDLAPERINHPSEKVKVGETVKAQVLEIDREKHRIRLGVKQLLPTPMDEYITGHEVGQVVTGRVIRAYPGRVELDEGIDATCPSAVQPVKRVEEGTLAAKLAAVWKPAQQQEQQPKPEEGKVQLKAGEVRRFRLTVLDKEKKRIEVEPA